MNTNKKFKLATMLFAILTVSVFGQAIDWSATNITITTETQLRELAIRVSNMGQSFNGQTITLANDIDISSAAWNLPIGVWENDNQNHHFRGTFDGNGKSIIGLHTANNNTGNFQGLFGVLRGTIKNLILAEVRIRGGSDVGGLVGRNHGGTIENTSLFGLSTDGIIEGVIDISGSGNSVGGLVGRNQNGRIINSRVIATVQGRQDVGGLVGWNVGGVIERSYFAWQVSGHSESPEANSHVGGLVGRNSGVSALINNSYFTGEIIGFRSTAGIGGLVGRNESNATIQNSYSVSHLNLSGVRQIEGMLVGQNAVNSSVLNSYASGRISIRVGVWTNLPVIPLIGTNSGAVLSSATKTEEEMRQQSTFVDWDFENIWEMKDSWVNDGFPSLRIPHDCSLRPCNDINCNICNPSSIRPRETETRQYGIILEENPVSDSAVIFVRTPESATITLRILDNLGNTVFETNGINTDTFTWNLRNQAGRLVTSGTYLILVEARGQSGRFFLYSSRVGVNR